MKTLIRYLSYPVIAGGSAVLLIVLASQGAPYWPLFPLIVAGGVGCVALIERIAPFERSWNSDREGATAVDAVH